jgi:SNF2 family DNA or RNA helicase
VALLWRAQELGFLGEDQGFGGFELAKMRSGSGAPTALEVAAAMRALASFKSGGQPEHSYFPVVSIHLDLSSDRLGVQIRFDDSIQEPTVFEGFRRRSSRALDELLLSIVDDQGIWDEEARLWYVNSSDGISTVLGLLDEYHLVFERSKGTTVKVSKHLLNAQLSVRWTDDGADLQARWIVPSSEVEGGEGQLAVPRHEVFGNGPYWTLVDGSIYRLSTEAAHVLALFPSGSAQTLSRAQLAPLLEVLSTGVHRSQFVIFENPEAQPQGEQHRPQTKLLLSRGDLLSAIDRTAAPPTLSADLQFIYPEPPNKRNVVILPDRGYEKDCHDQLLSMGFRYQSSSRQYACQDDAALDIIAGGRKLFPKDWTVEGWESLKRGIRFADSKISVVLSESVGDESGLDRESRETERKPKAPSSKTASRAKTHARKVEPSKIDWFDCHVSLVLNNSTVPLSTLFKNTSNDDARWLRLDSGAYTRVPAGSIRQLKGVLGMLDPNYRLSNSIKSKLSAPVAVGLSRSPGSDFSVSCSDNLRQLATRLEEFKGIKPLKVPSAFKGKLRPYQQQGVNWLGFLSDFKLAGILADEMGLGKTVQTLAFLLARVQARKAKQKNSSVPLRNKPSLIVAPTSVIMNWYYEAQRFTPGLKVAVLHGPRRRALFPTLRDYDLVITSYALLRIDRLELERQHFDYVVLDEAQHIKNFQAATTSAAKSLSADNRLALSGTPTENRPLELWSIFDFLMPGYLGTHAFFRTHIERPILDQGGAIDVAQMLRGKTRPFVLRRTKAEVERDLPPKIESVLHVEMTESQRELYNHILEEVRPRVLEAVEERGVAGASVSILAALLRLRQVCNHPKSIDALKDLPGYDSGKFGLLQELLDEALVSGRKILVFAQFREMLRIIRNHLDEHHVTYCYLDGATRDRQPVIERFNSDPEVRVFLISLKAGGLGLNLTAADTVVIYDPWWNPAVENQAVDRAHRIGQKKTVHVYRLVTEDSVEQKIMSLKAKKSALVDALINDNGLTTAALTKADIESLFAPLGPGEHVDGR